MGKANAPLDLDFGWFEMTCRVNPDASDLAVADLMMEFGGLDVDDVEQGQKAMAAMSDYLVGQIHPDDKEQFWRIAKRERQTIRDIMEVAKAISAGVADFRSGQPSDSSATRLPIATKSPHVLSSVDGPERSEQMHQAALAALPDRADMRVFLYRNRARQRAEEQAGNDAVFRGPLGLAAG